MMTAPESAEVLLTVDGEGIATVTLNRPEMLNALTDKTVALLHDTMWTAATDPTVRVILLTGAGRGFCAGAQVGVSNVQTPHQIINKLRRPFDHNRAADFQSRHAYFPAIEKPVIAVVNGPVVGLGLLYALSCDVRFASDTAVFTVGLGRLGLGPEYGIAWFLERAVGNANALELLLSSRKVAGAEVERLGLANFVVPHDELLERATSYARDMIRNCSPQSFAFMKRRTWELAWTRLAEHVRAANADMLVTNASDDYLEAQKAFYEKRPASFTPWSQHA